MKPGGKCGEIQVEKALWTMASPIRDMVNGIMEGNEVIEAKLQD
jgi:hypothetical protein